MKRRRLRGFRLLGVFALFWHQNVRPESPLSEICMTIVEAGGTESVHCDGDGEGQAASDALFPIIFDSGHGPETLWAYREPAVSTFYRFESVSLLHGTNPKDTQEIPPSFTGQFCQFVNFGKHDLELYWKQEPDKPALFVKKYAPMSTSSITAFVGYHLFFVDPTNDIPEFPVRKGSFYIEKNKNVYVYDPIYVAGYPDITEANLDTHHHYNEPWQDLYREWHRHLLYADLYHQATNRSLLSPFRRPLPIHYMWPADYFGQAHEVNSIETWFLSLPDSLEPMSVYGKHRNSAPIWKDHRQDGELKLTLKVLSCVPRVFEIQNFLSNTEVEHLLALAIAQGLHNSTSGSGTGNTQGATAPWRRSKTAWIQRERSAVVDAIYRRAAHVFNISERLLRDHKNDDGAVKFDLLPSAAEPLQVVKYETGEEYRAHHDFGVSELKAHLNPLANLPSYPTRFATLLMYLNDVPAGGETAFPRWKTAHTSEPLLVRPELGKAVLFYNMHPDGNMDERSMHAAKGVLQGQKYIANLWVWDDKFEAGAMK